MENVLSKRCKEEGCKKQPSYNYPGETAAFFCSKHKLPKMEDIRSKRCKEEGCTKYPSYNYASETTALFCIKHKLPTMENVVSRRCKEEGCKIHPSYNYPGETGCIYCSKHKLPTMMDVSHRRCSNAVGVHTTDDILPIARFKGEDSQWHCFACFAHAFPHRISSKMRQEQFVLAEIQRRMPELQDYPFQWDCPLACTLKRPDLVYDCYHWYLHFEIDEHGHRHEDNPERLREIHEAMGGRPGILVRINPNSKVKPMMRKRLTASGHHAWSGNGRHFRDKMQIVENHVRKLAIGFLGKANPHAGADRAHKVKLFF